MWTNSVETQHEPIRRTMCGWHPSYHIWFYVEQSGSLMEWGASLAEASDLRANRQPALTSDGGWTQTRRPLELASTNRTGDLWLVPRPSIHVPAATILASSGPLVCPYPQLMVDPLPAPNVASKPTKQRNQWSVSNSDTVVPIGRFRDQWYPEYGSRASLPASFYDCFFSTRAAHASGLLTIWWILFSEDVVQTLSSGTSIRSKNIASLP
jgi:hypothetical protein